MRARTAIITIVIFGIMVVIAAYLQRGEIAFGAEWVLPVIAAAVVPLKEERRNDGNHKRDAA